MLQSINASKIVALNTYATAGGAARAAMRLNTGLRQAGLDLAAISRETYLPPRYGHNHKSRWLSWLLGCLDILPCKLYPNSQVHNFSSNWMPDGIGRKLRHLTPDLIHLHWIGDGFLRIESLARFEVPIVWTLHDSWPFTGGCHLPGGCRRYQESCGCCPVLGSSRIGDLSR